MAAVSAGTRAPVRPHIIIARMPYGTTRYYVRSDHAADVYYRVECIDGWLTCTCPTSQQRQACKHLAVAVPQ